MFTTQPVFSSILLLLAFPGGASTRLYAEETPETDNRALYIESKTEVASAQCMIDGGNEEDDKKRTDVGIGEEVNLTLTGKRLKEVDLDSIEWSMEPDSLATIEKSEDGDNQAVLTINKNVTENKTLTIRVKTNLDEELPERKPLILKIFIPSDIKATHRGGTHFRVCQRWGKRQCGSIHRPGFDPAPPEREFQQHRLYRTGQGSGRLQARTCPRRCSIPSHRHQQGNTRRPHWMEV